MTFNHEAVAALPVGGPADAALIRAMCTRRFAYVLAASETPGSFVAVDPASGVVTQMLFQNNISFLLDPLDSTTTSDGVTCLVSSDGKRFKAATITPPYSVLTRATVAQPASPAVGDTYLIPTAATGTDWSGKDGQIGIYTAAGWRFAVSPIGRFLYVKDETAFYHRAASGAWTAGVGSIVLGANSVNLTNVLGAKASFVIKVENQTTNAPPASPTAPTAYIIGPSPTGAWAGNAGKLAICLAAGAFTIITPNAGDAVYDKARNGSYTFNGSAWISSAGAWVAVSPLAFTASDAVSFDTSTGSSIYIFSSTVAPTTNFAKVVQDQKISYTAKRVGSVLRVSYQAHVFWTETNATSGLGPTYQSCNIGLFRDSEVSALKWATVNHTPNTAGRFDDPEILDLQFYITAIDTLSHTYQFLHFAGLVVSTPSIYHYAAGLSQVHILIEESS